VSAWRRGIAGVVLAALLVGGSPAEAGAAEASPPSREPYRVPEWAALRSLALPGWGQHYNGEGSKGWVLTTVAVVGLLLASKTVSTGLLAGNIEENDLERDLGWFLYGGSVAWATVDAYLRAQVVNRENGYDLDLDSPGGTTGPRVTLLRLAF
jgi:hypothetical protein